MMEENDIIERIGFTKNGEWEIKEDLTVNN